MFLLPLVLALSGCRISASAEDLYALPRLPEEYEALSAQLSEILASGAEYAPPQTGGNLPPVQMVDLDGDGRLDLSIREKAYLQIEKDAEKILKVIDSYDGALPFTDKASPETIKREMQMSKNEFKRAVGHLLKEKKIIIGEKAIRKL